MMDVASGKVGDPSAFSFIVDRHALALEIASSGLDIVARRPVASRRAAIYTTPWAAAGIKRSRSNRLEKGLWSSPIRSVPWCNRKFRRRASKRSQ